MAMLLAVLAFALAFGALWFTAEVAKRVAAQGKLAMKPHLAPINAALNGADERIRALTDGLEAAEREIKILKAQLAITAGRNAATEPESAQPPAAVPFPAAPPQPSAVRMQRAYNA